MLRSRKGCTKLVILVWIAAATLVNAQVPASVPQPDSEIHLYDGIAPGSEAWTWEERSVFNRDVGLEFTQNVVRPALLYYAPDHTRANGTAVIIAPGGGWVNLTIQYEGTRVAQQLAKVGVSVFVLKYRLVAHPDGLDSKAYTVDSNGIVTTGPQTGQDIRSLAIADGRKAIDWVRSHATRYDCDPRRVGFVGFSAGGEIACKLASDPPQTRPNFLAPIYGVGSGDLVPVEDAPPIFLATASDDVGNTTGSLAVFDAWQSAGRPAEIHVFQTGGHAFLKKGGGGDHVVDRLIEWMSANGW